MNTEPHPIDWIDEYIARIRDYVFLREEDRLLIKVPNQSYRLNPAGVQILRRLLDGETVLELWESFGGENSVRSDLYHFMTGLKQVLEGSLDEKALPEAVEAKPFELGFNALPVLSEIAVTYRCNLKCRFCYAGCSCTKKDTAPEMTTKEVKRILHIIRHDAQTPSVSFTGGEPTLRTDLPELVAYARHTLGLRVNLITNGALLTGRLATMLAEAGLQSAQISIEGPDAQTHDALTQVPGSFEASVNGLKRLRAAGISVHTNTTINRVNMATVALMPAFIHELGLERFSMNLIIPAGSGTTSEANINLRYTDVPAIVLPVQREARRYGVEFMWYSPTPICAFNPIIHQLGNKGCAACDGLLSVSPSADVLPCSSWPEPVGNLLTTPFRDIWHSSRAQWLREKRYASSLCHTCEDFALCQGGCPLYWEHFGHDELNDYGERYVTATC